jgi:hypothetical protein
MMWCEKNYDNCMTGRQRCQYQKNVRQRALRYLMFIKEERDGAVKVRGCTDGRPQWQYTYKEDLSSPMVSLEAMMMSCCIDAKEGRYVAVTDIPGAFLHMDMNQCVHMIIEVKITEHGAKFELGIYRKYIWHDKRGKPILYIKLKKALYGTLQMTLIFWQYVSYYFITD